MRFVYVCVMLTYMWQNKCTTVNTNNLCALIVEGACCLFKSSCVGNHYSQIFFGTRFSLFKPETFMAVLISFLSL